MRVLLGTQIKVRTNAPYHNHILLPNAYITDSGEERILYFPVLENIQQERGVNRRFVFAISD